ncbi:Shedu anti-phage system protein SduA domain-containing protein [Bradyrhizobium canariense]|uniref:Shedu anti-phage system protein SduA domain-containing protein n=1 Tax=Bradyrhizobium canariense TaxID=255045 RepID=UPI001B8A4668|nr:Shedu anti-phage system protein SduA domain-containing protein [Bradyrhizobium canariense]MBR0951278.1 DUF4263 domain-containing protein [Bradyrhizobium canariense]
MSYFSEFYELLRAAVTDGGRAALKRVEAQAKAADDLEITFPTYAALASWGQEGLDLIVKVAITHHTVRSKSAALTLLALLARQGELGTKRSWMIDQSFQRFVNDRFSSMNISSSARQSLRILIMSLPTDDLLLPLSQSFVHLQMESEELVQELVSAFGAKWLHFGPPVLKDYEEMIEHSSNDEAAFQEFFCTFPQLLDPMAIQVWSQPNFHGAAEPDFVVRRTDDSYLVIEIETPGKLLLTKAGQLSREAIHAEKQALDYESFLADRLPEARLHFPNYRRADCLAVIGLERTLTSDQRRDLDRANSRRQNLRVCGFDWLLERARAVVSNVGSGGIEVVRRHRMI